MTVATDEGTDARPVVVGVDGSEGSAAALRFGADAAAAHGTDLVALLARPTPRHNPFADFGQLPRSEAATVEAASEELAAFLGRHDVGRSVEGRVHVGPAAGVLLDVAADARLLVVGSRGLGTVASRVLGSTSLQVVHHARGPVAVVHVGPGGSTGPAGADAPVVVGIDGSSAADAALRWAAADAAARRVPLRVVMVWDYLDQPSPAGQGTTFDPGFDGGDAQRAAGDAVARVLGEHPAQQVEVRAVLGLTAPTLAAEAEGAAELVVGSRGRGGFAGLLLGSTSTALLHRSPCPVVVHRDPPSPDAGG